MKTRRKEMDDEQPVREASKICGVCGDRALGYNFNAVSCESCKAFFRRNALKKKGFRCPFTENCNITPVTRRFCQKCRLDKCFNIGMRKEYILSEEDKVLKRKKIEENRAKKRPNSGDNKMTKIKRESIDESNFDNDTPVSIASLVSTASTVSETYFWESDRKYTDLDANRQTVIDSLSPVTAASVPSPSSSSDNSYIAGSKTLEMLKDLNNSVSSFPEFDQITSYPSEISMERRSPSDQRIFEHSTDFISLDKKTEEESGPANFENLKLISTDDGCFEEHFLPYSRIELSCSENIVCSKPSESCSKSSNLAMKIAQDPGLVTKMASNPLLLSRIFQNQEILKKILMDPKIISKLTADPSISQLFGEILDESADENAGLEKNSNGGIIDDSCNFETQINQVESPLMVNFITNQGSEEGKIRMSEPSTSDENKPKIVDGVKKNLLQKAQRLPMTGTSIESILSEAIKLEFSAFSSLDVNHNIRELNNSERGKLNELIVANKALHAPLEEDISHLVNDESGFKGMENQSDPALLDVINLTAIAIRRLIKMSKKINAFKNMCEEDQLALLKGGCTEMMILRSAINYDPDKHVWKIPHSHERMSNIRVDVLKEAKGNLYDEHAKFVRTFDPRWKDENIILILTAIALFTPDRPKVVHSDVIKLEQNSYYFLLRRYLESIHPGCEAKSTFLKLIQKISELHKLNDEVVSVYLNVNPSRVEPLLIEIFDLKQ